MVLNFSNQKGTGLLTKSCFSSENFLTLLTKQKPDISNTSIGQNCTQQSPKEHGSNVSTTPLRQWGFRQCLPFSWTTLKGKHCRHPIVVMGVVDTFGFGDFKAT